jgi:hypothetical protein
MAALVQVHETQRSNIKVRRFFLAKTFFQILEKNYHERQMNEAYSTTTQN